MNAPVAGELPPHGYAITKPVRGSAIPMDITFVLTRDEIYVPIAIRKPAGDGPFPVITMGRGDGKGGVPHLEAQVDLLAAMQDEMIGRGYVVVYVNYRNEVPHLYENVARAENLPDDVSGGARRTLKSSPTLDSDDLIAIFKYLRTLPYVKPDAIGAIGVSHSGEMILKVAAEMSFGAGVAIEGASHEFLSVDTGPAAPRKGNEIQYQDIEVVRKNADKARAMERIGRINTPILHLARDKDHLQGIFRLVHEWMLEAGRDSTLVSFDHPSHGYPYIYRKPDGSYQPEPVQLQAFDLFMAFFDRHLKKNSMTRIEQVRKDLGAKASTWLITGVAGFIGSNLLEALLKLDQRVAGLDNFFTGHRHNLDEVRTQVTPAQWRNFRFIEGDIRSRDDCGAACAGVDYVLHHAALGSVPRSLKDPVLTNACNVTGFLNVLVAAHEAGVRRFTYAASSSTYGDHPDLPKVEENIGRPLSPYAVTKYVNELYADVFARCYGMQTVGLRYFNVFGPRQDPQGAYAAVIPRWIAGMIRNEPVEIYGDGETFRDFCYVENVLQANLLAATAENPAAVNRVYNVALGDRTTLNELFEMIRVLLAERFEHLQTYKPQYRDFRAGDVRFSQADIGKARALLGYAPTHRVADGMRAAIDWYVAQATAAAK